MKGFVRVYKQDLMAAIIGFEMRLDAGKVIRDEAIIRYYDKYFPKQMPWNRWLNRNQSKHNFVRGCIGSFGTWLEVLDPVLTSDQYNELNWWQWTHASKANAVKALYKATMDEYALVDQDMAEFVTEHKNYLEGLR